MNLIAKNSTTLDPVEESVEAGVRRQACGEVSPPTYTRVIARAVAYLGLVLSVSGCALSQSSVEKDISFTPFGEAAYFVSSNCKIRGPLAPAFMTGADPDPETLRPARYAGALRFVIVEMMGLKPGEHDTEGMVAATLLSLINDGFAQIFHLEYGEVIIKNQSSHKHLLVHHRKIGESLFSNASTAIDYRDYLKKAKTGLQAFDEVFDIPETPEDRKARWTLQGDGEDVVIIQGSLTDRRAGKTEQLHPVLWRLFKVLRRREQKTNPQSSGVDSKGSLEFYNCVRLILSAQRKAK